SIRSASLYIKSPRCAAVSFLRHGPLSKALRAAATALSTSAASASATCAMVSPVAGLMVGKLLPEAASVHWLLIISLVALTFTFGSMAVEAVAMLWISSQEAGRMSVFARGHADDTRFLFAQSRQDRPTPLTRRCANQKSVLP